MRKHLGHTLILFLSINVFGQTTPLQYNIFIQQADSLRQLKDYKASGFAYSLAFQTLGNKGLMEDRYNAARVWSLANIPDSSFNCLERIIKKGLFTDFDQIVKEEDFNNLHSDSRWNPLLDTLQAKKTHKEKYSPKSSTITVKNNRKKTVYVYWLDYSHKEIFYFDLEPNQEKTQQTYIGHVWIIRQKKDLSQVIEFMVTKPYQRFDTNGQIPDGK